MSLLRFALAGCLVVGATTFVHVQSARTLTELTVPANQLPAGCSLKPADPKPVMPPPGGAATVTFSGDPLSRLTNPWAGTDRRLVVDIRKRIDGEPQVPDAPRSIGVQRRRTT